MVDRTCIADQCSRIGNLRRGYCTMHYQRLIKTGRLTLLPRTPGERFWAKVDTTGECWLWMAARYRNGYGAFNDLGDRMNCAHRFAFQLAYGPIPDGLVIDHICHVRLCVRPDHLRAVTQKQNVEHRLGAQSNSKSGIRGVDLRPGGRWRAQVRHMNRTLTVGMFDTAEEAGEAARLKRIELFTHNDLDRR